MLAGCTVSLEPIDPTPGFDQQAAEVLEHAEQGGASAAQLEIIEQAIAEGEMSLEGARAAAHAVVDCIGQAGTPATYVERTTGAGLVIPVGAALANTVEEQAIVDACMTQENFWVDYLYQTQPSSVALQEAFVAQQVPLVRACLEDYGTEVPDELSNREVLLLAVDVARQMEWTADCLRPFGIDGV